MNRLTGESNRLAWMYTFIRKWEETKLAQNWSLGSQMAVQNDSFDLKFMIYYSMVSLIMNLLCQIYWAQELVFL